MGASSVLPPLVSAEFSKTEFLAVNGYFDDVHPSEKIKETDSKFKMATRDYQDFAEILPDGVFGPVSLRRANDKRCALPDKNKGFVKVKGKWKEFNTQAACTRKWATKELTCTHDSMIMPGMSKEKTHRLWWAAKVETMKVCGLKIRHVPFSKRANAWHTAGNIDGPSGVLAWQFLCGCGEPGSSALEGRYDISERYSDHGFQGTCNHEDGHWLGLDHDSSSSALMYPYMRPSIWTPQPRDIRRLVDRYGKPLTPTPDPDPPVDPTPPGDFDWLQWKLEKDFTVHRHDVEINALFEMIRELKK